MKDVRVDVDGEFRCWNCGARGFTAKRTFRSKAMVGVGALLTKKKLKCQRCGEYNDTGNGKPYNGPAGRKFRKEYEAEQAARSAGTAPVIVDAPQPTESAGNKVEQLAQLAALKDSGAIDDAEFAAMKAEILGATGAPAAQPLLPSAPAWPDPPK